MPDTGKNPMEEAVDDRNARKNKNDRLFFSASSAPLF